MISDGYALNSHGKFTITPRIGVMMGADEMISVRAYPAPGVQDA
jgi:hypothetical protein